MTHQSQTAASAARPLAHSARTHGRPALVVLCLGVMMSFINVSSTISALSPIQADLHISASTMIWVSSAFSLVLVSLVLSAGTLGDLVGRRRVLMSGIALFTAGSLGAFLAGNAGLLIAAQALMGVGSAAILPSSLAIVSHTFPDPQERTGAISTWAGCAGVGLAAGPLVAGALLDQVSWHSVFLPNVALGVLALVLTPLTVSESRIPSRRLDLAGVLFGTLTLASATYAIIEGGGIGYSKPVIIVAYLVFAVSLAAFVKLELHHRDPMLQLRLFKDPSFTTVMGISAVTMFGFVGIALLTVLYLERVAHDNALTTGVKLLPMYLSYVVVSVIAARLVRRAGVVATLVTGLVIMSAGAFALLAAGAFSGYNSLWPGLLLAGVGSALLVAPSTAAGVNSVPPRQAGMAAASVNTFRQLGSVMGPSVLGTLVTALFPRYLHDRLTAAGLPATRVHDVVADIAHDGTTSPPASLAHTLSVASPQAFSSALHLGWFIAGLVLLAMTIPTLLFLRRSTPAA
ncbi:MFS transporter [Streptomyces sp. NPDC004528]|uniref:MFS transporter n=1 Tax=Streptomyces sp. NPDC004528 TaxID=3154550 RepID=UPI0033B7BC6C